MEKPRTHSKGLKKWYDKLAPLLVSAREELREVKPAKLVLRSGCTQESDGAFRLTFFWRDYLIHPPTFAVERADAGEEPSSFLQALILTYLVTADGTTPSKRWVAFHDLPDGMFYAQAFRGYAEERLVRELGRDGLDAFRRGAEKLNGEALEIGGAGYSFRVLPRVRLAAVYWLGDEDFPSRASILFEDTAPHYMPVDGLAILGSHLVSALLRAEQG
ncbi:MAG: DUF3786 domain-containing protein [Anaerolineae bacterium]